MKFKKQNRGTWGKGRKNKIKTERETNHKRLLKTEQTGVTGEDVGGVARWVMGIKEDTCWDEHWVCM